MDNQNYIAEINLIDYIRVLYKYRRMIIVLTLAGMLLGGAKTLLQHDRYEAWVTFFPMNIRESYTASMDNLSMKRQLDVEDLIVSILESREMADRIIEQLKLNEVWNTTLISHARNLLSESAKVSLNKNGLIRLAVVTGDPQLSAQIANAHVDNLDYFNRELNLGAERQIVNVIDRAAVPEERMPRNTVKKILLITAISGMLSVFLAFLRQFIKEKSSGILIKLKEIR